MQAVKAAHSQPVHVKKWKAQDWIDHASFGVGQVSESRGDKLDIDFVDGGRRTLLKSTEMNGAVAPSEGFKFPTDRDVTLNHKYHLPRSTDEGTVANSEPDPYPVRHTHLPELRDGALGPFGTHGPRL